MRDKTDWNALARYLAGECSPTERADFHAWIRAEPSRRVLVDSLCQVWRAAHEDAGEWDAEAAWSVLVERFEDPRPDTVSRTNSAFLRKPRTQRWLERRWAGARRLAPAAAIIISLGLGIASLVLLNQPGSEARETTARVFVTARGQRSTIRLSDGTRVGLNVDSELRIPAGFRTGTREVALRGQAYFEVAPDAARPFIVAAGKSVVRVLGTRFGVSAYPLAGRVEVVVAEGEVAFYARNAADPQRARLTEGQLGRLHTGVGSVVVETVDPEEYLAWMEGQLVFDDTPFSEVLAELERWYDLEFEVSSPVLAKRRLTASFDAESIGEVLGILSFSLNATYRANGRTVVFLPKQ